MSHQRIQCWRKGVGLLMAGKKGLALTAVVSVLQANPFAALGNAGGAPAFGGGGFNFGVLGAGAPALGSKPAENEEDGGDDNEPAVEEECQVCSAVDAGCWTG